MNKVNYWFAVVVAASLLGASPANGQQATEVYIPIGESPGVSAKASRTGVIHRVDYASYSIEIRVGGELRSVSVDSTTQYFIDRSKQRRKSATGTLMDCKKGQTIEVWTLGDDIAKWIKIETG